MSEQRLVILVPTEKDRTDGAYLSTYWPNFVCNVQQALRGFDCRIVVAGPSEVSERVREATGFPPTQPEKRR